MFSKVAVRRSRAKRFLSAAARCTFGFFSSFLLLVARNHPLFAPGPGRSFGRRRQNVWLAPVPGVGETTILTCSFIQALGSCMRMIGHRCIFVLIGPRGHQRRFETCESYVFTPEMTRPVVSPPTCYSLSPSVGSCMPKRFFASRLRRVWPLGSLSWDPLLIGGVANSTGFSLFSG